VIAAVTATFSGWFMELFPFGFRIIYPVAGVFGILSTLSFCRVVPVPTSTREPDRAAAPQGFRRSLGEVTRDAPFMVFMACYFVLGFPDKMIITLEPIRFVDELGMNYGSAGMILGAVTLLAGIGGFLFLMRYSHKLDPFPLLVATAVLTGLRLLGIALATDVAGLVPGSILGGVANAGWDLLPLFTIGALAGRKRLALYFGLHNTLIGVRGLTGPVLGTWLHEGVGIPIASVYLMAFWTEMAGAALLLAFWAAFLKGKPRLT
jgi:hypothetical protein